MSTAEPNRIAPLIIEPITEIETLGPAMRDLVPQQRAFVKAMCLIGGQSATKAAAMAGYSPSNQAAQRATAWRLTHDQKVLAAIREEAVKTISSHVIMAASVLAEIAGDPLHKDRLKAANMLLDRGGMLIATQHTINVNVKNESTDDLIARATFLADKLGLDPRQLLGQRVALPAPTDAEFEVVGSSEGLEDLLG